MISVLQSIRPRGYYWRIYKEEKGGFGSVFGFLMTMIGFAVGIGSLWRFPYICGTNGGALFIVTYIVAILFVGIPLLTAEMSMGFKSRRTAVGAYKELEPEGSKWHLTGLRIPGSSAGLKFLFNPDVSNFHFSSFTAALGQAFFAIGIGMLASMVFGSCVTNREEHLFKDCSIISVSIIIAGVFAGLMIFPICFAFNLEPAAGVSLSMITLPNAFNAVAGGRIIGTIFYVGFFIAAFSSSISMAEAVVNTLMDMYGWSRRKALADEKPFHRRHRFVGRNLSCVSWRISLEITNFRQPKQLQFQSAGRRQ